MEIFHPFKNYTVYPAIAALKFDEGSDSYALRKGMYVLPVVGEGTFALLEPKKRKEF
ncbi:MAG: hypothetical protein K5636_06570 [Bacteroidales bacterium]|nr:hypothetical protein [Bacteroidales bacterium]